MQTLISKNISSIQTLLKKHGVISASLFGSATGNHFDEKSDIDLLVKFNPDLDIEAYSNNYFDLMYALQDLLKREVDIIAEETITNPYFAKSINQNKIALI